MKSETVTENSYLVTHDVNSTGERLDAFLKERYRKRSREQVKQAIDLGHVQITRNQGRHVTVGRLKPSTQLIAGDQVLVVSERKPEPEVDFNYKVLFEDDVLYVIDKPANLPVHPAGRYFFNTLLTHLKTRGHTTSLRAELEYYLVHRIDKETSGVLVLAKEREACTNLTRQFSDRTTQKKYLAIAKGFTPEEFEVNLAMKRSTTSQIELKMMLAPEAEGGQSAMTRFKRVSTHTNRHGDFSLVECYPKTGRQHQIRVHLEAAGHPILGDKLYGMPEDEAVRYYERRHMSIEAQERLIVPRHALHAVEIKFEHPTTGITRTFTAPMPQDFAEFLKR